MFDCSWCRPILLGCVGLAIIPSWVSAADWPQFLGPQRNGISAEKGLLKAWPEKGPAEVWRVKVDGGMAGIAIAGGRAYTMVQTEGQQAVLALDALTGKKVWQTPVAKAYRNGMGDGPRATPTVAGDQVFVFTGEGILAALGTADGKVLWQHPVVAELDGEPSEYGMSCSPLVHEDLVLITAGAPEATVAAYDRKSGELAWKAGTGDGAGYSSPVLANVGGQVQAVVFNGDAVEGLAPATGKLLWRYPFATDFKCNTASPAVFEGQVFISSGENHGCALLALQPAGGKLKVEETWTSLGPKSVLRSEWQTPLVLGDHIYGFDNVGGAGPVTHLTCIEAATGKRAWQEVRFGKGNFIAADGKLFITTMKGELIVAEASPEAYKELGRGEYLTATRQAPALADGRLYLRDDKAIVCLDVRGK